MRSFLFIGLALAVMGLAFWAYSENYRTQASIAVVEDLHRDIASSRARLAVLKAEWAYLNRPDRLRDLAEMNFKTLELLPLTPDQFGAIDQIAFPSDELPITEPIDLMESTE